MSKPKPIQIFKPGKHVAMSGAELSFSESDLAATAAAYDPAKYKAPIVVGHPKHDSPAYGQVAGLVVVGGRLEASPENVDEAFAEMVKAKRFTHVSASFYSPDSPQNPVPGVYYLRHVGFLGAQPPAVKGLRPPEFADNETGIVEFADYDDVLNASLWRRLRDWMIGEKGLDVADSIIPDYAVATLEDEARKEDPVESGATNSQFAEPKPKPQGDDMSVEDKARLAALETENTALKKNAADFAEAQTTAARTARHAEHVAFAEALIKEGRLLPAYKNVIEATLDFMAGQEAVVEFGEGDARKPLVDGFRALLQASPKQVEFAEVGRDVAGKAGAVEFAAAPGYTVDAEKMAVHLKALSYAETNKCDYVTAVKAVGQA